MTTGLSFDQVRTIRTIGRLSVAYLLDMIAIARGDGHPMDTLLASAIIQANVAELIQRPDGLVETDELPTDDMRRPVSVSAVATSLNLPFETVRRRVSRMVRDGFCQAVDGGVIVPSAALSGPKHFADAFRGYERLRAFYYELRDHGVLGDLPAPAVELSANNFPVRTVTRLVGAYILRVIETMGLHGDLIDGLILMETFRSNVEHLPADRPGMIADHERAPISANALAVKVGLPAETVRRRTAALTASGVLVRVRGGLTLPSATLTDPRVLSPFAANASNLQRLFATLSRLGVLRVWDQLQPPQADAAAS